MRKDKKPSLNRNGEFSSIKALPETQKEMQKELETLRASPALRELLQSCCTPLMYSTANRPPTVQLGGNRGLKGLLASMQMVGEVCRDERIGVVLG